MSRRAGWKPPKCSSDKQSYRTGGEARRALHVIEVGQAQAVARTKTPPVAEYKCRECGAWHLTKQRRRSTA